MHTRTRTCTAQRNIKELLLCVAWSLIMDLLRDSHIKHVARFIYEYCRVFRDFMCLSFNNPSIGLSSMSNLLFQTNHLNAAAAAATTIN